MKVLYDISYDIFAESVAQLTAHDTEFELQLALMRLGRMIVIVWD